MSGDSVTLGIEEAISKPGSVRPFALLAQEKLLIFLFPVLSSSKLLSIPDDPERVILMVNDEKQAHEKQMKMTFCSY